MARGLALREARWLLEEFGADPARLERAVARRLGGEPLQYVIGHWPFRGLDLLVDSRALIPRPETEELVGVALGELARSGVRAPHLLDLGCGTGAIGLSLLSELAERGVRASLVALDASEDALDLARENARRHAITAVAFVRSDWFDELDLTLMGRFDLIVANPPYVGAEELVDAQPELAHEPRTALLSEDTAAGAGFADLAEIIERAPTWLCEGGVLVCEHGAHQGRAALAAARAAGFAEVRDVTDMAGHARILVARS